MHGEIDAEALLGVVDEILAERHADIDHRDALAVADDRRDGEIRQRIAPRFDADDRLARSCCASTTVVRRDEMSSPNAFGSWMRGRWWRAVGSR